VIVLPRAGIAPRRQQAKTNTPSLLKAELKKEKELRINRILQTGHLCREYTLSDTRKTYSFHEKSVHHYYNTCWLRGFKSCSVGYSFEST
jgi:hypothetical protein